MSIPFVQQEHDPCLTETSVNVGANEAQRSVLQPESTDVWDPERVLRNFEQSTGSCWEAEIEDRRH